MARKWVALPVNSRVSPEFDSQKRKLPTTTLFCLLHHRWQAIGEDLSEQSARVGKRLSIQQEWRFVPPTHMLLPPEGQLIRGRAVGDMSTQPPPPLTRPAGVEA